MSTTTSGVSKSLLAMAMVATLSACGGGDSGDSSPGYDFDTNPDNNNIIGGPGSSPGDDGGSGDDRALAISWDSEATVMQTMEVRGYDPAIAVSDAGNVLAVWIDDSSPRTLWGRYYDKASSTWSLPTQLDMGGESPLAYIDQSNAEIAFLDDSAIVVWEQGDLIYSTIYDENGWMTTPQVIDSGVSEDPSIVFPNPVRNISVSAMADGSGAIAVYEYQEADGSTHIRSSAFSDVTSLWSSPETLSTNAEYMSHRIPLITDSETGDVHAAWVEAPAVDGGEYRLMAATNSAGSWGKPELVDTGYFDSITAQPDPDSDRPVLVWVTGGSSNVYAARYQTGWVTTDITGGGDDTSDIESTVTANGDIVIAYVEMQSNQMETVYTHRLDMATGTWGERRRIPNQQNIRNPSIAADGKGRVALAYYWYHTWFTDYTEENGWSKDYKVYGYNGGREPSVVMNEAGDAAMIWRNSNGNGRIYVLLGR